MKTARDSCLGVGVIPNVPYHDSCRIALCAWCREPGYIASSTIVSHTCPKKPKANRGRGHQVIVDGRRFHSLTEARRYAQLRYLEEKRIIQELECQPRFVLEINGVKICEYKADFRYKYDGNSIVEDVKGYATDTFKLKMKMMRACHPAINVILVRE